VSAIADRLIALEKLDASLLFIMTLYCMSFVSSLICISTTIGEKGAGLFLKIENLYLWTIFLLGIISDRII
jgi:hypothetical protein